ncbi:MAG: hypothetical protein KJS87_07105 [Alphaproteobacteria bacterium]|nr:hypothetical protein [Alphaproteobacteria bacterium]
MSESESQSASRFKLPSSAREFWALVLAVLGVFLLVQLGAPIIRTFEFLDPKLRDYFIGMSFAAFPFILDGSKRLMHRVQLGEQAVLPGSPAWYVTGTLAGALLFAWNQFVSGLAWVSLLTFASAFPDPSTINVPAEVLVPLQIMAVLVVIVPMCIIAAFFAGLQLNRYTRSHVPWAVLVCAVFFFAANMMVNFVTNPELTQSVLSMIASGGAGSLSVLAGMSGIGIVVLASAAAGVMVSRLRRERPLGQIVEAVRGLPRAQRDQLAQEVLQRIRAGAMPAVEGR